MRVLAIQSCKDNILRSYGEGVLVPNQVPDVYPFNAVGIENPCILLDTGKYVWGYQCWWAELGVANKRFEGCEVVIVDVESEVKPMQPGQSLVVPELDPLYDIVRGFKNYKILMDYEEWQCDPEKFPTVRHLLDEQVCKYLSKSFES